MTRYPVRYRAIQPRLLPNSWKRYRIGEAYAVAAHPFSPSMAKAAADRYFRSALGGKRATHKHGGRYK